MYVGTQEGNIFVRGKTSQADQTDKKFLVEFSLQEALWTENCIHNKISN